MLIWGFQIRRIGDQCRILFNHVCLTYGGHHFRRDAYDQPRLGKIFVIFPNGLISRTAICAQIEKFAITYAVQNIGTHLLYCQAVELYQKANLEHQNRINRGTPPVRTTGIFIRF